MRIRSLMVPFLFIIIILIGSAAICDKPYIDAQSAILMDAKSKRILADYNIHARLPIASTTKVLTALIALEKGELADIVEINNTSVGIEGSSIYLKEGEVVSLEDLLYGLMLRSGNDSAIAIANHIGGCIENFALCMNERAKQIGAVNSNFVNPHGLPNDNHYSTAYDLALITSEAMKLEEFRKIIGTQKWIANRQNNNIFYNKNKTLWEYPGGDGVKIGYTIRSGRCLITSATRNGFQLIAVVLNDGNWFKDCYKLMDYGFENYESHTFYKEKQFITAIPILNGEKEFVSAVSKGSFVYPLKKDELDKIKINIDLPRTIEAPIKKDDKIGSISIYFEGRLIHRERIIAEESVDKISIKKRLFKRLKNL